MIFLEMIRRSEIRYANFEEYSSNIPLYSGFLGISNGYADCRIVERDRMAKAMIRIIA